MRDKHDVLRDVAEAANATAVFTAGFTEFGLMAVVVPVTPVTTTGLSIRKVLP